MSWVWVRSQKSLHDQRLGVRPTGTSVRGVRRAHAVVVRCVSAEIDVHGVFPFPFVLAIKRQRDVKQQQQQQQHREKKVAFETLLLLLLLLCARAYVCVCALSLTQISPLDVAKKVSLEAKRDEKKRIK